MEQEEIPVNLSCQVVGVSRSGFYSWLGRTESKRQKENIFLMAQIQDIHVNSRKTYGVPRIQVALKNMGYCCGKARVSTLMKKAGICGLIQRRFKVRTTDSNHNLPIADRIFKTEDGLTHPKKPNEIWASDISYIPTEEGFVYLATYLDLFTRKVVGFSTQDHMTSDLILSALKMGLGRQNLITHELLSHSDRGSQYASDAYRGKLKELGIKASMSRKGNCWDNSFAESFFATLKKELIYRTKFKTKEEAKK